jgi:hypothetical protein
MQLRAELLTIKPNPLRQRRDVHCRRSARGNLAALTFDSYMLSTRPQSLASARVVHLVRTPVEPTRAALQALASTRKLEISGFVDGLFGDEDQLDLPVKAQQALDVLIEAHSMFAGAANLLADTTKEASEQGLKEFSRNAQKMTEIAEQQINKTIQACKRARAHALEPMAQEPTHRPDFCGDLDDEPDFVESPLSQSLTRNGITVRVEIYANEDGKWILEVVDQEQTSHVWDEHFDTDQQALAEAIRALEEEPMEFMAKPESARDVH